MRGKNATQKLRSIAGLSMAFGPGARSPSSEFTDWREYVPMLLVILTVLVIGWLWRRIKKPIPQALPRPDPHAPSANNRDQ